MSTSSVSADHIFRQLGAKSRVKRLESVSLFLRGVHKSRAMVAVVSHMSIVCIIFAKTRRCEISVKTTSLVIMGVRFI